MTSSLFASKGDIDYGSMQQWKLHPAYSNVTTLTSSEDKIYALSEGSLFAINKADESLEPFNKLDGLSGADMQFVTYNKATKKLVIIYKDGMIDVVSDKALTSL